MSQEADRDRPSTVSPARRVASRGRRRRGASLIVAAVLGVAVLALMERGRAVHEVRITLTETPGDPSGTGRRATTGFDIDLTVPVRAREGVASSSIATRDSLPTWIEPTTRRGGPGAPEQVIVTMGADASVAITADHVVLMRGDESVVVPIGADRIVEPPADAPDWLQRADARAPLVARFGRAGSIEVAASGIRVQRRGPG